MTKTGLMMITMLVLFAVVGVPLILYGATARDTIGGLNIVATLLAGVSGITGIVFAIIGLAIKRVPRRIGLPALLIHVGLVAATVVVLMTREFDMGYGP